MALPTLVFMETLEDTPRERQDWIATISLNHVRRGAVGGFMQADHGARTRLARLRPGDRVAFYSPRTDYPEGEPLQQFTAWGTVMGDDVYQVTLAPGFHPWRLALEYSDSTATSIRPLLGRLSFIPDERNWGITFRRGLFRIPAGDFDRIVAAMASHVP